MIKDLPIDAILPPLYKFRTDVGDTTELKASMQAVGQKYPILVRPLEKKWRVIDGWSRLISAKELGWEKISAIETSVRDEKEEFEVGLLSNIVRRNFNPIDEAHAYDAYIRKFGYGSGVELAKQCGISSGHISARLRLIGLPESVLTFIKTKKITASHGEAISRIRNPVNQQAIVEDVLDIKLTAEQTDRAATLVNEGIAPKDAVRVAVEFPGFLDHQRESIKTFDPLKFTRQELRLHLSKALMGFDAALKHITGQEQKEWIDNVRYPLATLLTKAEQLERKWNE